MAWRRDGESLHLPLELPAIDPRRCRTDGLRASEHRAWMHFISRMEALSPDFTWAWAAHDVAHPASYLKIFRHPRFGRLTATSTSFAV